MSKTLEAALIALCIMAVAWMAVDATWALLQIVKALHKF